MSKGDLKRLGDYIQEVDVRNRDGEIQLSQGICNQKYFQDPKQVSATPASDKIVRTGQFAYNRATTRNGDKISIALRVGPDCTVSSAYCVFYVTDTEVVDPHWLWLWFKRPEFDRYAIFKSHGSAHEFFEFDTLCNTYINLPPIEEQQKIVERYKAIQQRIEVNRKTINKLEEAAQAIYRKMFADDIDPEHLPEGWRIGTLSDVAHISSGKTCKSKQTTSDNQYCFPIAGATGIIGWSDTYNQEEKLLTTGRVGTLGKVCRYFDKCWTADNVLVVKSNFYEFCYQLLKSINYDEITKGGVQSLITQTDLSNTTTIIPPEILIRNFEEKVSILFDHINKLEKELQLLNQYIRNGSF